MRYFLKLAYKGTNYHGWQVQPNALSVQEVLENKLSVLLKKQTPIVGCGRTDTGVHALDYFLHFETEKRIENFGKFLNSLNALLPHDIAVYQLYLVEDTAHARFSALERSYIYKIEHQKNPFTTDLVWNKKKIPNIALMQQAIPYLLGTHDFSSFAKLHSDVKHHFCNLQSITIIQNQEGTQIQLTANRFLRNMVRALVGTFIDISNEKYSPETIKTILVAKNRCAAGSSVPAKGLYLSKILYPKEIFIHE